MRSPMVRRNRMDFGSCSAVVPACLLLGIAVLVVLSGCVVPVRVPTQSRGPNTAGGKVVLPELRPGQSSSEVILEQLRWADTGMRVKGLYLFRWTSSSWGYAWLVAGASPTGAGGAEGGFKRDWSSNNLLAEFDEHDVLRTYRFLKDAEVFPALLEWTRRAVPPWPEEPVRRTIGHRHAGTAKHHAAHMILTREFFEFAEIEESDHNFRVPRQDLLRVSYAGKLSRGDLEPAYINHTLHFRRKTKAGQKVTVRLDGHSMLLLAQFLSLPRTME